MKYLTKFFFLTGYIAAVSVASAVSINFAAQTANNLAGVGGADLAFTDTVSVGTWDGTTFSVLDTTFIDGNGIGAGFFAQVGSKFNSTSIAGIQLALQFSEAATNRTGLIYYDIMTGTNANTVSQWTLKSGDGGGLDQIVNELEVADLAVSPAFATLDPASVLINVEFSGSNLAGVPSFNLTPVPEPSTYAALVGMLALGFATLRRRR